MNFSKPKPDALSGTPKAPKADQPPVLPGNAARDAAGGRPAEANPKKEESQ